jgi:hypothetical protein
MDPSELASEPTPCYARRGRIEPPISVPIEVDGCQRFFFTYLLNLLI